MLLHKIITPLMKRLKRRSVLVEEEQESSYLADSKANADSDGACSLLPLQATACTYRIAFSVACGVRAANDCPSERRATLRHPGRDCGCISYGSIGRPVGTSICAMR